MLVRLVRLFQRRHLFGGLVNMQEKKDPGQGDMGGSQKQWPGDETGKQGGQGQGQGDLGKKGGSGDVGREGGQGGQGGSQQGGQSGTEKKY
jgi:hypothetical protein